MHIYKVRVYYRDGTTREHTTVAATQGLAIESIYNSEWLEETQVRKITAKKIQLKKA